LSAIKKKKINVTNGLKKKKTFIPKSKVLPFLADISPKLRYTFSGRI